MSEVRIIKFEGFNLRLHNPYTTYLDIISHKFKFGDIIGWTTWEYIPWVLRGMGKTCTPGWEGWFPATSAGGDSFDPKGLIQQTLK